MEGSLSARSRTIDTVQAQGSTNAVDFDIVGLDNPCRAKPLDLIIMCRLVYRGSFPPPIKNTAYSVSNSLFNGRFLW